MNDRTLEKQRIQTHLVDNLHLCAVPIWKDSKRPAFQSKGKRHDDRPWTDIVEADKGKSYDMEKFDLGIKGTSMGEIDGEMTYFLWADVDFHDENDKNVFMEKIYPIIQDKGFLVTQSPSGGFHIGLRTTEDPKSTAKVFEYPNTTITVDFRASHTQCVVIDSAGKYNVLELPHELIYMDFDVFKRLFTERIGFVLPAPPKSKMESSLREFARQYLAGEEKPDDIDTNLWMLGVIRYLMGIHGDHEEPITEDAIKALKLCKDTHKDDAWVKIKVIDCLSTQKPLNLNPGRKSDNNKPEDIARELLETTPLFSDKSTRKLYITENGFLQEVTIEIKARITKEFAAGRNDTEETLHFLIGYADDVPETHDNKIRFKNGVFSTDDNSFNPNDDDLCLIGYPNYNYNPDAKPERFMDMIESQVDDISKNNLSAWLKKIPTASKEIRMAILYGKPGCGKTALAETLEFTLGDFAYGITMKDFFGDRATMANIIGKTYLYFQDTPKKWEEIDRLKQITGETKLSVRGMYEKSEMTKNMLSIVMSTNTLAKIDTEDEGPMFDRLTLIQFRNTKIRGSSKDDEDFALNVARDEGEDIISYCLNLRNNNSKFDDSETTRRQWREISCPEIRIIKDNFTYESGNEGLAIHDVMKILSELYDEEFEIKNIKKAIKDSGFSQRNDKFIGLKQIILDDGQEKLD